MGLRRFGVQHGRMLVLPPDVGGELKPRDGAHVLGFNVEWARFEKHRQAAVGAWSAVEPVPYAPVSMQFETGWRFLAYIDRLCREVNQSGSLLQDDRVAREVVDTIGCLLAEIMYAGPASRRGQRDEAMARRAEEFLAESLISPVSLSDAAIAVETSTRSLLRTSTPAD